MKPLNSKERSKQLWQFVFIFFGLCIIPVSLIFFSYYTVPEKLSEAEQLKLKDYSDFERSRKLLVGQLSEIDSNISKLARHNSNSEAIYRENIAKGITSLTDTSTLIKLIANTYTAHFAHVEELVKGKDENVKLKEDLASAQSELQNCQRNNSAMQMQSYQNSMH